MAYEELKLDEDSEIFKNNTASTRADDIANDEKEMFNYIIKTLRENIDSKTPKTKEISKIIQLLRSHIANVRVRNQKWDYTHTNNSFVQKGGDNIS